MENISVMLDKVGTESFVSLSSTILSYQEDLAVDRIWSPPPLWGVY